METQFDSQQTLSDFFAPSKRLRIWRIILAAITSIMVVGAAYFFTLPKPDPEILSYSTPRNSYVYLDLQLLSDWIYDVSGDEDYTLYEAMDADGNWFILSMSDKTYNTLSTYVDAYNAYFTDDYMYYNYPEPTRLTGMTRYISSEDVSQLATYYSVTESEVTDFFGSFYLDVGASNLYENAIIFVVFGVIFGLLTLALFLQSATIQRNYKKSDLRLYELGLLDDAEAQFSSPDNIRFSKARLVLSKDFAFSGTTGWVLPYEDIGWLYQRKQRSYGVTVATHLVAGLVNGKTVYLASRAVNDDLVVQTAQATLRKNQNCMVGYSYDNMKQYRLRVKEYKLAHPK